MSTEIRIVGGTKAFEKFIRNSISGNKKVVRCSSLKAAITRDDALCQAYIFMPEYEKGQTRVPEIDFDILKKYADLKKGGQRLFIENYDAGDYTHSAVFGHIIDSNLRHFFTEYVVAHDELANKLPGGTILQARDAYYFPGRAMGYHTRYGKRILLTAADCIGTHKPVKQGSFSFPVLMRLENYFCSAMNLTQFNPLFRLPVFRWRSLFAQIFSYVLQVPEKTVVKAFDSVWKPLDTVRAIGNKISAKPEKAVLKKALNNTIMWHQKSGILLHPSGKKGCFEMIRSHDLKIRANIRMDSDLFTGLLFYIAGKNCGNKTWMKLGENLVRFLLDNGIQIRKGYASGFFKWFIDMDEGPDTIWSSDVGRAGIVMINMYKLTRNEEYLQRSIHLADAVLKWFGKSGLLSGCFRLHEGYKERQGKKFVTDNPVYYAEMSSFLLQLYKQTDDKRYKNAVLKYACKIINKFPDTKPFGYSDNFTYSRFLLMTASVQEILNQDCSKSINKVLHYFAKLQHPSGGLAETPIRLDVAYDSEAGVGIGNGSDHIADMLYCNNFVLCALSVIKTMKNCHSVDVKLASKIYQKLLNFILNVQISSKDPRLNGGWMRAYDMDHGEYYGLNKDKDWGAYCIMAGWITGYIPLVFLNELGEESIWI